MAYGRPRSRRRGGPAGVASGEPTSWRVARPSTWRGRFIACGASSPGRSGPTATRAGAVESRSRAWLCCGWGRAIRRAMGETRGWPERARLLPAYVEIMLAVGGREEARDACVELGQIADEHQSAMLGAMTAYAWGAVALAGDDAGAALISLRRA